MGAIQRITPKNRDEWLALRTRDVTSTEASALFGQSPYCTEFELWHRKASGDLGELDDNTRMTWGKRLQDMIAKGVAADQGWKIRKLNQYMRDPDAGMGASFDFEIVNHPDGTGILEVKNVDRMVYRDTWEESDGQILAPAHIEIQVAHQMEVSGRGWCMIVALVGGNEIKMTCRLRDPEVGAALRARIKAFWDSVKANQPPAPDYTADAKFISRLYRDVEEGRVLDARDDADMAALAARYAAISREAKALDEEKQAIKAQLLTRIGPAEKALLANATISAKTVAAKEIAFTREQYRDFRVTTKKEKTQ